MLYKPTLKKCFVFKSLYLCVSNKIIDGKQCTVVWYVDDNKISHADTKVVPNIFDKMKEYFGDIKIYRGNSYVFLGINIVFRYDKKYKVDMKNQLFEAIKMFEEEITGTVK